MTARSLSLSWLLACACLPGACRTLGATQQASRVEVTIDDARETANDSSSESAGRAPGVPPHADEPAGSELVAVTDSSIVKRRARRHTSDVAAAHRQEIGRRETGQPLPPPGSAGRAATHHAKRVESGGAVLAAQVCWVEAGWRLADCAAITRVLVRRAERAGWSVERMARAYSAIERDHARAAFARQLPAGLTARELERWSLLRAVAEGALDGRISSPCRGALHWGGPKLAPDVRRAGRAVREGRWKRVRCSVEVANAFYAETGKRVVSAREAAGR
jgi:hypothetical protein